jgi:hypothetical protein
LFQKLPSTMVLRGITVDVAKNANSGQWPCYYYFIGDASTL